MSMQQYYTILGLPPSASFSEVKKAYRKQAFQHHPDHNASGDAQKFIAIQEAYTILEQYHKTGQRPRPQYSASSQAYHYPKASQQTNKRSKVKRKPTAQDYKKAYEKRKAEKLAKDQKLYQEVYDHFCSSWRIYYSVFIMVLCSVFAVLVLVDYMSEPFAVKEYAMHGDYISNTMGGYIIIDDAEYQVSSRTYYSVMQQTPVVVYRTPIFKDIYSITVPRIEVTGDNFPISMVTYGPLTAFFLLLPAIGFLYKRPDFNFTFFFIHYTMYFAPLLLLFFLLSNGRIYSLLHYFG